MQNASRGTFDGHRLKLYGVAPVVSWFADRPQRSSGVLTMRQLLGDLFGHGPVPNAALDFGRNEVSGVLAVQLRAPRYDARRRVLSYRVRRLSTLRETKLAHLESERSRARIPRHFGPAALFIDDGQAPSPLALETFTEGNFDVSVIDRSSSEPVVVAFTASWCAPCHEYIPNLNVVATNHANTAAVGTVDTDENPNLVNAYPNVRSVPTTLIFRNGVVVDQWAGAVPVSEVDRRITANGG